MLALLHEFFADAVRRWPERVALDIPPGDRRAARVAVTYAELDASADALAQQLRPFIPGECVVGVLLPRTNAHLHAAQLATLKAGAAYVCLEPSFPDERIREILEDARVVVLLTDAAGAGRVRRGGWEAPPVIEVGATLCGRGAPSPAP